MLNFDLKSLGIVSPPHFVYEFLRKVFLITFIKKCKAIKDLQQGTCTIKTLQIRSTVSTIWFKNHLLSSLEKGGSNWKILMLRASEFKDVNKAVYSLFVAKRSQRKYRSMDIF